MANYGAVPDRLGCPPRPERKAVVDLDEQHEKQHLAALPVLPLVRRDQLLAVLVDLASEDVAQMSRWRKILTVADFRETHPQDPVACVMPVTSESGENQTQTQNHGPNSNPASPRPPPPPGPPTNPPVVTGSGQNQSNFNLNGNLNFDPNSNPNFNLNGNLSFNPNRNPDINGNGSHDRNDTRSPTPPTTPPPPGVRPTTTTVNRPGQLQAVIRSFGPFMANQWPPPLTLEDIVSAHIELFELLARGELEDDNRQWWNELVDEAVRKRWGSQDRAQWARLYL
ncbi:hypothetical protein HD806DRAFT_541513 [Xylariaceae sp. AK1471]|nr:hypothetical protein HD806DRAFT_541513 [Xylariaceae sp. AK1471]